MKKFRYLFAVLGSAGMAIIYGLKVNLSVAIVAMVNQTAAISAAAAAAAPDNHVKLGEEDGMAVTSTPESALVCEQDSGHNVS